MIDPKRLERTHVVTCRFIKDTYYLILSDGSKIIWAQWVSCEGKLD